MSISFDEITLGDFKKLRALFGSADTQSDCCDPFVGKYCVVRTCTAGVHVGVVKSRRGTETVLTDAKRIWNWQGANTLSEISLDGIATSSKVSEPVDSIFLTQATEFIPCTPKAEKILRNQKWQK
jgi:hypothetical protein